MAALALIASCRHEPTQPVPAASAPEVRPVAATGAGLTGFTLDSVPTGAEVWIDWSQVGWTPIRLLDVAPGDHRVRVRAEGYQPWETWVAITDGVVLDLPAVPMARVAPPSIPPTPSPAPLPKLPPWPRGRGFPPDFEVELEHYDAREGAVTVTIRALDESSGRVTFATRQRDGSRRSSCILPIGRAAFDRFGFAQMMRAFATGKGLRVEPRSRIGAIVCDFGARWRATRMRAFGREVSRDDELGGWDEITVRALDMVEGTHPWGPEAVAELAKLDHSLARCIEYPAGAEIAYEVTRKSGEVRPLAIGSHAHSGAERACVREELAHAVLGNDAHCDLRVSLYVPGPSSEKYRAEPSGVIRLRSRPLSALDHVFLVDGDDSILDAKRNLLLLPAGRNQLELEHAESGKSMTVVVDVLRGRERTVFVDLTKLR